MGRTNHYLRDRARILRPVTTFNRGVVDQKNEPVPVGDWIPARLRGFSGGEAPDEAKVDLTPDGELVLALRDESGNEVAVEPADQFELRIYMDRKLQVAESGYEATGEIREIRKNSTRQSFIVPVNRPKEY